MATKEFLLSCVDKYRDLIFAAERYLWNNPAPGYREWKASAYLEKEYEALGYRLVKAGNIPGFYTDIDTGRPGPKILILGELDSLICRSHPESDPETGAVHCCGHNAQSAGLLGLAAALKTEGALDGLCGSIRLCAVPAEETIELDFRKELRENGTIHYYGGKSEFMYRGFFDGCDMAFMLHTMSDNVPGFKVWDGHIGFILKTATYKGVSSHAGGAPENGVNALYAATLGLQAINNLRETFVENKLVRVHPIITAGGDAVNAIPDKVVIETFVRAANVDVIKDTNFKVNRALAGAAVAIGANLHIDDLPGCMPIVNDRNLLNVMLESAREFVPAENVKYFPQMRTGSTDMGDISCIMPAAHPCVNGSTGVGHGNDYYITYPEYACVNSAKCELLMIHKLLSNDAAEAKKVIAEAKVPCASKEAYFKMLDNFFMNKEVINYGENGQIGIGLA